ncbi:MAG: restriction endonuclease subunit S [Pasteurellaceae bacterium]|nr:restriction endonuclease subunit S [Pasteurellaceae bacterium]
MGKVETHLTEQLQQVEWEEFKLGDLFEIEGTKSLDSNAINFVKKGINFVGRTFENNGIQGLIEKREFEPNSPFTITATVIGNYKYVKYQKAEYYCSQNINKLTPKEIINKWNERVAYFFVSNIQKFVSLYDGQQGGYKLNDIKKHKIKLPTKNGKINFDFMENFISQLEAFRLSQLEAYLLATGLKDYTLNPEENQVVMDFEGGELQWREFNLEKLFGKATRGKRLKSADRIEGSLPFVTAGEADTGISAFIGNKVDIFKKNTTTIDMFGSAKYRNYDYGGDDHIAVVHTEGLNKYAAIFTTTAIHKSSYTGKFSYARNFYAKDADELNILLPVKNNMPDYDYMALLISAIQKLVIKDVVLYADRKIAATKQIIECNNTKR